MARPCLRLGSLLRRLHQQRGFLVCRLQKNCLLTRAIKVIGSVSTMLTKIYGDTYSKSSALKNISAITFAGTVFGQLVFGYTSDKWSRKNSLLVSTFILIIFAALGAGSYGAGGSTQGLFAALTAYRFLVGVGIGQSKMCTIMSCSRFFPEQ